MLGCFWFEDTKSLLSSATGVLRIMAVTAGEIATAHPCALPCGCLRQLKSFLTIFRTARVLTPPSDFLRIENEKTRHLSISGFRNNGGEGEIRTLETFPFTRFPGVLLRPLGHLTKLLSRTLHKTKQVEEAVHYTYGSKLRNYFVDF